MSARVLPTRGRKSPRYGHRGVWNLSLGPNSPVPGERLEIAILDEHGAEVRRFEQRAGRVIDQGYVDFFNSSRCRPSVQRFPLVDVAADGTTTELCEHYEQSMGPALYLALLGEWAAKHGKEGWAL